MKQLRGSASELGAARVEECFALLQAVDRYPTWHPAAVRRVEVLERHGDGRPSRVAATLHVSRGPVSRDLELVMTVASVRPSSVTLTRLPNEPSDPERFEVRWRLDAEGHGTRIGLEIDADLDIPRMLPLAGIGDATASAFVAAAAAAVSRSP